MGIILLVVLILSGYGVSMAIHTNTLVHWWIPLLLSLFVALATGRFAVRLWSWVFSSGPRWLNYALHAVVVTALLMGLFYAGNYFLRGDSAPDMRSATVTSVYSEKHYKTRRVGRRYHQSDPYWVDKMDYAFSDGLTKSLPLTRQRRRALHVGDTLLIPVRPGFFGVDVIETASIVYPAASTSSAGKRNRRLPQGR